MGRERKEISPPRGVTVRKHKNVESLQIDFTWRARRYREAIALPPTAANFRFADGLRREILGKIAMGTFVYGDYFPNSPHAIKSGGATISVMLEAMLTDCKRAVDNKAMSPSTLDGYRKIIRGQLIPQFGAIRVTDLTAAQIKAWIKAKNVTAKTAKNLLTPLRMVLDDALNDEVIQANPIDKLALGRLLARNAKPSAYVVDPFTPEEVAAILATATGQARNLFQFAFATGLRTSELIALRWDDVDLAGGVVHVRRAVVVGVEKTTKTTAGTRSVRLSVQGIAALKQQREHTILRGARVFSVDDDQQIRKGLWQPILRAAGVRYRNPYQTRHTFASTLLSRGENPWFVAEQMGHENVEMIFKHYGKWLPEANARHAKNGT